MRNSHWLMAAVAVLVIVAAWALFPRKVRDSQETWRVRQEQQAERQQNPPVSGGPHEPTKSSGAGSASDTGRGPTGVPTGTSK